MIAEHNLILLTVGLAILVAISGFVVLGGRYGYGPAGTWLRWNRWLHLSIGILLLGLVYVTFTRVVVPAIVAITGLFVLAGRYGYGPGGRWRLVNRWVHVALGVVLLALIVLRAFIMPPGTLL